MGKDLPAIKSLTETELVAQCVAGQADAQELLYRTYFEDSGAVHFWVYQKAYWIPDGDKEDILNDIFLAVVESLNSFEFKSSLRTYITRIAKMKCLDAMPTRLGVSKGRGIRFVDVDQRRTDGEPVFQVEDTDHTNRPDSFFDTLEENERVHLLHTALVHYTGPRCREVLRLYIRELREEISRSDTAAQLGVSSERAGQMVYDCLYRLRKRINNNFRDYQHFSDYMYDRMNRKERTGFPHKEHR